jgi:glycosyltransferase involved in cell wall biosynthesis
MQCGTPVISANTTSLPEIIENAGILLPPTDVDAWCQAMLTISRSATERNILRERGIERSTFFSWQKFIDATISAYNFACNNA